MHILANSSSVLPSQFPPDNLTTSINPCTLPQPLPGVAKFFQPYLFV